ncbi:MAG TPA: tetratricopeptide repeat protein, partial [Nitrospirota bacterium]|nr:tetratricopeptide repeat protein [Nitrospirota bacterium]
RWWACGFRYTRGVIRYAYGKYNESIADFLWILKDGSFAPVSCLVYENLGINYARLEDFVKAEEYLTKSSQDKTQDDNGYLFMWLGYIHLINNRHDQSLNCFRKAQKHGRSGYQKWLVQEKYVEERINMLEDEIRKKYTDIFSNN